MLSGAALLTAACIPAAEPVESARAAQRPAPAPAPAPIPAPTPTPTPSGPAQFTYAGETEQGGWIRGQAPAGTVSAMLGEVPLTLDPDGMFFAAFDRDAGPEARLTATLADGTTKSATITVRPRDWQIERVNTPLRPGGQSSEAFMRRRQPELDAIWNARTADSPVDGWRENFIWPAQGRISGRFGSQRIYQGEPGSYHSGLDIAGGAGAPVVAPASGKVTLATTQPFSLEGNLVIIDHGDGLNSAFLHLSRIDVTEGQMIRQGDPIGLIGASGRATGPHLHWSIKWHLARLDPLLFLPPR
ncbi:M23 family peptidase [Aurantiacibacter xanthus]|uniref:M23 family peptidase n=1 Tax=Aurantiacibacter xanthus TaxID=1784712 RepID=A0A3A1P3E1_9SPHN|nr:M23 family metallopeptidase [Aurantiacibacter xanthus]RIV85418.1 M23 family peptidase [Aurantiacibacter xanthus]